MGSSALDSAQAEQHHRLPDWSEIAMLNWPGMSLPHDSLQIDAVQRDNVHTSVCSCAMTDQASRCMVSTDEINTDSSLSSRISNV
jgi:hypothetical protein